MLSHVHAMLIKHSECPSQGSVLQSCPSFAVCYANPDHPSFPCFLPAPLPLLSCKTAPKLTCEAQAVSSQTVVSRETNPLHSQVVSLTRFNTGDNAYNVIPDVVKLGATYRSLTHEGMVRMKDRFDEV